VLHVLCVGVGLGYVCVCLCVLVSVCECMRVYVVVCLRVSSVDADDAQLKTAGEAALYILFYTHTHSYTHA